MTAAARTQAAALLDRLRTHANPDNVAGMARFGISSTGTLGVSIPVLRGIARELRPLRRSDPAHLHALAAELWASGVHEGQILATFIDVPALVTPAQADAWVADLDSWDTCDQSANLWAATDFAYAKAVEWAEAEETFIKRSGFVVMCSLAVHDKAAPDERLVEFLPLIERHADDDRNFVKKAVNWALRQIGKRSADCHGPAVAAAERIRAQDTPSARWIANDALRELRSEAVLVRLGLGRR
ncbi:MAG: DNA alkylation repair protein [Actinobacteria bacterium HGW-Actinobacteria-2]|nr:MAG: DNA alkylation repair protein [Actinobacteria bacterium HGW-Actinobacteria-2]